MCLCIDLVLTIWYPFSVAKNRTKHYMSLSFIISMILTVGIFEYQKYGKEGDDLIVAIVLSIYIFIALYSVIFSWRRLNRPGMSA